MGNYIKKRGEPNPKEIRIITKNEYALLRKYGAKRTFYIGNNIELYPGLNLFKKINGKFIPWISWIYKGKGFSILKEYWSKM